MKDSRIEKLADVLVNYSIAVQPDEKIFVQGPTIAAPLLKAIYAKVLQAGAHPYVMAQLPGLANIRYRYASDAQLAHVPEPVALLMETYDARIALLGSENTKEMSNVDPAKMVLERRAQTDLIQMTMKREAAGEFRWVGALFPTNAHAQDAEMSLEEYEDFVFAACLPEMDDPLGYWRRFSDWQQKIVDWFAGKKRVRVLAPDTDLRLSIAGRRFINCNGTHNMPDGEVFTSPVEDSVEDHVTFSYPTVYGGHEVSGVQLTFEKGRVVKATAAKNENFLLQTIDTDEGARAVGEFAIGTNKEITRITGNTLFDEKIDGSFHIALGMGFPEIGSTNQSAIHWGMVCSLRDGGEIWVDDTLLYKNGAFAIAF